MGWLLDRAPDAVRARALLELAGTGGAAADDARRIALAHLPAVRLALGQAKDGTWGGRMLALPKADDPFFVGVGTIPAVRRLSEYGWPLEAPPLWQARRPLFRLLAQDDDPGFLYELRAEATDASTVRLGRLRLREGAAAALAQMGLESDPRLRGTAARALERTAAFLKAEPKPAGDALPETAAPPSIDLLVMLAHMPAFRSERGDEMGRLAAWLAQPAGVGAPRQRIGRVLVPQPRLVLGDPLAGVDLPDTKALPRTLAWLELLARMGFLRRHEPWRALLDRLLEQREPDGRWTRPVSSAAGDPLTWPLFPLGDGGDRATGQADVTFRLALIAKLAGRPLLLA